MDHLNLDGKYRESVSYATYGAEHPKMKKDLVEFMEKCLPK